MIQFNGKIVPTFSFPDGTPRLSLDVIKDYIPSNQITWRYEGEYECMVVWHLAKHIREKISNCELTLYLPYVPNARYDRTKKSDEVFTLKYFADFINSLHFTKVVILDPHSNVTPALLNNVEVQNPTKWIHDVIDIIESDGSDIVLYFPDEGAMKRYQGLFPEYPFLYGEKKRDWSTGEIQGLELRGCINSVKELKKPSILMIDDICSYGGTFYHSSKKLKEQFPNCFVNSWATHTENDFPTLEKAFNENLVVRHFTTNSTYCYTHDKVKTFFIC